MGWGCELGRGSLLYVNMDVFLLSNSVVIFSENCSASI